MCLRDAGPTQNVEILSKNWLLSYGSFLLNLIIITHISCEVSQIFYFMSLYIDSRQTATEWDQTKREIMFWHPKHDLILLKVWSTCHVDYKIAIFLPVTEKRSNYMETTQTRKSDMFKKGKEKVFLPYNVNRSWLYLGMSSSQRNTGWKCTINTEHHCFAVNWKHSQITIYCCVVTSRDSKDINGMMSHKKWRHIRDDVTSDMTSHQKWRHNLLTLQPFSSDIFQHWADAHPGYWMTHVHHFR